MEAVWDPRVLVVDDDEISRASAAGLLQALGLSVDVAVNGREALEISAQRPYAAIFMDCEMPEVDGYTAVTQLRRREGANRRTPVIALTSRARFVSMAAGMDHHITKPVRMDELRADCLMLGLIASEPRDPESSSVDPDTASVDPDTSSVDPGADTPLLDPAVFGSAAGGYRTLKANHAVTFIEQATVRLPELWRAANAGDAGTLRTLALALKPRAEAVGAARVSLLCDHLSYAGATQATAVAVSLEAPLRRAFNDTRAAIRAWVDGTASSLVAEPSRSQLIADRSSQVSAQHPSAPVRVLLADDDPLARTVIAAMLETADWIEFVGAAPGVQEVVALAATERPDVVLLDWMMPGGGGAEAARRIHDHRPQTLIVGVTSSDSLDALTEMIAAGASCLISKGGTSDQLTQTIARALTASGAARATGATQGSEDESHVNSPGDGAPHPRSTSESAGWLDPSGVEQLRSEFGSTEIVNELVDMFGSQTPERLIELQHAIKDEDAPAVMSLAHQLKGGALTLAASRMAELCDELEGAARAGSLEGAQARFEQVQVSFEHALAGLRQEFN